MNMKLPVAAVAVALPVMLAPSANADIVTLNDGMTSVLLDTAALSSLASLDLSSVSSDVMAPGALGAGSVAFGITPKTTFSYDPSDFLGTFSGSIEHNGSVFFNSDTVEVGDFTIGFDAARVGAFGGAASGFFVESTVASPRSSLISRTRPS